MRRPVAEEHHSETRSNQIGVQPLQGKFCGVAQETVGIGECAETLLRNRKHGFGEIDRDQTTRRGPTARASSMARDPQPQPTSITVVPTTGAANASSGRVTGASIASRRSCSRVQNSPSIPFQRVRCCSLKVCAGVIADSRFKFMSIRRFEMKLRCASPRFCVSRLRSVLLPPGRDSSSTRDASATESAM